ncbi:MAG: hypothetical protein ACYTFZ_07760, partial [Planctomycetota bacterium]
GGAFAGGLGQARRDERERPLDELKLKALQAQVKATESETGARATYAETLTPEQRVLYNANQEAFSKEAAEAAFTGEETKGIGGPFPMTSVGGVAANALYTERLLREAGEPVPENVKAMADFGRMTHHKRGGFTTLPDGTVIQMDPQSAAQFGFGSATTPAVAGPVATTPAAAAPVAAAAPGGAAERVAGGTVVSGPKPLPAETASKISMAETGISHMNAAMEGLFSPDGSLNRTVVAELKSPTGPMSQRARQVETNLKRGIRNKIRLESGAQVTDTEVEAEYNLTLPQLLDDAETARARIGGITSLLGTFLETQNRPVPGAEGGEGEGGGLVIIRPWNPDWSD